MRIDAAAAGSAAPSLLPLRRFDVLCWLGVTSPANIARSLLGNALVGPSRQAATRLSPELQSDQTIDANVRLPPQTHLEADRDAIADERPHTASRSKRPFA